MDEVNVIQALYETYIYGLPLVILDLHKKALTNTEMPTDKKAPMNQYIHAKSIATSKDREVVHPNMDTVYSKAHINLKKEPIYIHKPESDRFAAAEIIDAYGNCVANIGTGAIGDNKETEAVLVGPDFKGEVPKELIRVDVPTNDCWTLTRILYNEKEMEQLRKLQAEFYLRPVSEYRNPDYIPPKGSYNKEYDFIPFDHFGELTIEEFFNSFNEMIGDNLGKNPDFDLLKKVELYGVGAGLHFKKSIFSKDMQDELDKFYECAVKDFSTVRGADISKVNWSYVTPEESTTANYKWNYLQRAGIAWGGFGALPAEVAIYPTAFYDDHGEALDGSNRYVVHFYSEPPVNEFWSLTAYGKGQFLIENEINRNGINDRSQILKNADGSFDLYLQKDRPSKEKESNWLPVEDGYFELVLRLYYAKEEFLKRQWKLPKIEKVS